MRRAVRSGYPRPVSPVGEVLAGLLHALPSGSRIRESLALAHWSAAVGPAAAAASEPERISNGVLFVRTKSSVWSQELSLLRSKIIPRLNEALGAGLVVDIRFRARGDIPGREAGLADPTDAEIDAVVLPPEDIAALVELAEDLAHLPDERRGALVLHTAERRLKVRRWRLAHGARACPRCSAAYDEPGDVCPVCRLLG